MWNLSFTLEKTTGKIYDHNTNKFQKLKNEYHTRFCRVLSDS